MSLIARNVRKMVNMTKEDIRKEFDPIYLTYPESDFDEYEVWLENKIIQMDKEIIKEI